MACGGGFARGDRVLTDNLTRRTAAAAIAAAIAGPAWTQESPLGATNELIVPNVKPRRIVSLNPCLDVILVEVAERAQIAALSHYSRDPASSSIPDLAKTFPITYETAEEVTALTPDLVLTGRHSAPATRAALKQMGVRAELFSVPSTIAESLEQVRWMAKVVHNPARGEALARRIEDAIAAAAPAPKERPLSALVFQANGMASASGTLVDEMLARTGFVNAATRYGLKMTSYVALERVIADPPDVLLAGVSEASEPRWADRVTTHPALARIGPEMYRAAFPRRLMNCGGPVLIDTARALAETRRAALRRRA